MNDEDNNIPVTIDFHGHEILTVEKDGVYYVAMKPICIGMGLDWDNEKRRINNDLVLNSTKVKLTLVAHDGKYREMICLPLQYLNGWLFKVEAGRYAENDPRRSIIILYQEECYQVLFDYWHKGYAVNNYKNSLCETYWKIYKEAIETKNSELADFIHYQITKSAGMESLLDKLFSPVFQQQQLVIGHNKTAKNEKQKSTVCIIQAVAKDGKKREMITPSEEIASEILKWLENTGRDKSVTFREIQQKFKGKCRTNAALQPGIDYLLERDILEDLTPGRIRGRKYLVKLSNNQHEKVT